MTELAVTAADVVEAAVTIAGDVVHTHSELSHTLSAITGADVIIKFENLQFTASFKDRGAANKLRSLDRDLAKRGVIAMSAGNHAQGVAYHAGRLGIPATIVMPESAPFTKVMNTETLGATVIQSGNTLSDAADTAAALAEERSLTWVHPYDDPAIIAGQGTVAVELLADHPDLDAIVVPVGGGGLVSGIATYARAEQPDIEIIGVQSEVYPGMIAALEGRTLEITTTDTLADGIAVKTPGTLTVPIVAALVDDIVAVPESRIEQAVGMFLEIEKTVAEGAAAAALALLLEQPERFAGKRTAIILSGGNIDTRVLASVLMREMVHTGRISIMRIGLPDMPGQLAPVVAAIAGAGANILEIDHRRLFDPISARSTNIDVVMETRDNKHARAVYAAIEAGGFTVSAKEVNGPDR